MVEAHLSRRGEPAIAAADGLGHVRVSRTVAPPHPLVTAIVPTRDRLELLRPCIEGLRHKTDYPTLEIIIADNGSIRQETLDYFASLAGDARVRVLPVPGAFNFAAINNAAVREARGRLLAFINNDIEVLKPDWLTEMAGHALRPEIGAVGAKLLYATGSVQHAGVIVGINGIAGHAHRFFHAEHLGYMHRLQCAHYVSAVTAACMVVERAKFDKVGGFDEKAFPVALNDVDLCLKLNQQGHRSYYTPHAVLTHKESASRAHDRSKSRNRAYESEVRIFRERWHKVIDNDPCYNPWLSRTAEDFSLL